MPKKKSNWVSRLKRKVQTSFRAKQKMAKETALKKAYAKHYKAAGKQAMTYAQWLKKGKSPVYFKGIKKKSVEARMRESGLTAEDRRKFERKK